MSYKRVLIIHHSREDRQLLKESVIAGSTWIVVKEADSDTEGYQLLQQQNFDVILSSLILVNFVKLAAKGTHIVILIPDDSPEQLAQIKQNGLEHYQIFPGDKEKIRTDLSSVLWDAISRQNPRFKVPDTLMTYRSGKVKLQGKMLDISERGVLCQLEVEKEFQYLLQNIQITVKFSSKYGGGKLEKLPCYHLATRTLVQQKGKIRIQLVLLFSELKPDQTQIIKKTHQKVIRAKYPFIRWVRNHLEINFNRTTHYFYGSHLIKILLTMVLLIVLINVLSHFIFEDDAELVWTNGQVYLQTDSVDPWEKIKMKEFPVSRRVTVRKYDSENNLQLSQQRKIRDANRHAVLKYTPQEMAILSENSIIQRHFPLWGPLNYQLSGAVQLIFAENEENEPLHLKINGLEFYTQETHVFFQDIDSPPMLSIVKGSISVPGDQDLMASKNEGQLDSGGQVFLTSQYALRMKPESSQVLKRDSPEISYFKESFLPGFSNVGRYHHIGYLNINAGGYSLIRNGERYKVQAPQIPIMMYDHIETNQKTQLLLKLHSGDRLVVYPNSGLEINRFSPADQYPLLSSTINRKGKSLDSIEANRMSFKGKIRACFQTDRRKASMELSTDHGMLTIDKAEFEAISMATYTEVMVLSGTVTVSDRLGQKSVKITRGMRGLVEKGRFPLPAEKILDEDLAVLLKNRPDMDDVLELSTYSQKDIGNMVLKEKSKIRLYWNTPLKSAELRLKNKKYSVKLQKGSPAIILNYQMFNGVESGTHSIKISVVDNADRVSQLSAKLTLDPNVKISDKIIVFTDNIQFEPAQSAIKRESHYLLQKIINVIKANPQLKLISIEGHCDNDGSADSNFLLSVERARQVKDYLVKKGILSSRLLYLGFGERKPIAKNHHDAGKRKNRRVEFVIRSLQN